MLQIGNTTVSYFASELSEFDFNFFGFRPGAAEGQQTWEALCALVALRLYAQHWKSHRITLAVRGDSVAMLTLIVKFKAPAGSRAMGIIAREVALDVAEAAYEPSLGEHIPGVCNKSADVLSRLSAPGGPKEVPAWLATVPRAQVATRDRSYFRALPPNEQFRSDLQSNGVQ